MLLGMLSKVCTLLDLSMCNCKLLQALLNVAVIICINNVLLAALDGTKCLKFYYVDLVESESVCKVIQDPKYANKLYHAFEM